MWDGASGMANMAGTVFGIAILLGGVYFAFKASYNTARIQALRDDNTDLRHRVDDLDGEIERAKQREETLEVKVHHLESENQLLREMVLQRAEVGAVASKLDEHHQQAMEAWRKMIIALEAKRG